MDFTRRRWLVLTACCFINLCIGSIYAWSILSAPMAEHISALKGISLTARDLSIVFIIANGIGPITMISGGKINDTLGPRNVVLVGGILFGGGMFLSGFATSVGFLMMTYGVILGLGLGMVYGTTISTAIKFFPDKRGLVGGLTTATFGISSVVIPPIAAAIISATGPTTAFKVIGAMFSIIIIVSAKFVYKCPADFVPDGWQPPIKTGKGPAVNMNWKEMLAAPVFYVMILLLMCGAFAGLMFIPLAAPLAKNYGGLSGVAITLSVSTLALFNVAGRIVSGIISDRIGRVNTLIFACGLSILGLGSMYLVNPGDAVLYYVAISIIGFCLGSFMGVFPGFTADQFGPKNNSVNYGIMFIGFAVAGTAGPTIINFVYAGTGSYRGSFLIAIGFSVAGLILAGLYSVMTKKEKVTVTT